MFDPATQPLPIAMGAPVFGRNGDRLGMVSAVRPDTGCPTHLLVFYVEPRWLMPREFPVPVSDIVRIVNGEIYINISRETVRATIAGAPPRGAQAMSERPGLAARK